MTHICISKLTIIVSDNGLSPDRRQAIIWTNDGILLIGPLRTNFSEILIFTFSFKKFDLNMSSEKCRPFCLSLNVLMALQHSNGWTDSSETWHAMSWFGSDISDCSLIGLLCSWGIVEYWFLIGLADKAWLMNYLWLNLSHYFTDSVCGGLK